MENLENFRKETRAWLEANCPPEMRRPSQTEDDTCWGGRHWVFQSDAQRQWLERMAKKGWTVPAWPRGAGPGAVEVRLGRTEARASAENRARRDSMVPGLLGTRLGLRPRVAANPRRGQRRSVPRQRLADLDVIRRQGRLDFLPRAHRPERAQARRHQLHPLRHGKRGRLDQAHHADLGRVAILPDFLRRRAGAEGEPSRQTQQGLGYREVPADA